ncbi:MAG: glutamate--tRNA ligase [Campylobacteraceae bacterium 4484_166]|nr:MAG: glutamate--tRNA ligase [Campylobacteraceae bacterium 4484_166]
MTITRFAPSPTGYLHIGGLRTALYNYLWAKKNDGEFKLRIEDTDKKRHNETALSAIFDAFDWVGMKHDGKIEFQSQRTKIYQKYINQLLKDGKAYKCYKTKDQLAKDREEAIQNKQTFKYDETWRPEVDKCLPQIPQDVKPVVRIKSPKTGQIIVRDGIKGDVKFEANEVDDFIIARDDGEPTYNFVVAIDDALMGISDVLRGDDHLSNTPKQIVIYDALGFDIPNFYHMPMINNQNGKKLSKRDGALDVLDYKTQGYLPEAILNFLVRLGWSYGDQEIFSIDEMIQLFDPKDINSSSSSFNQDKLLWLNSFYIKNSDTKRLTNILKELGEDITNFKNKDPLIDLCKQRVNTTIELQQLIKDIINKPKSYDQKGVNKFIKNDTDDMLNSFIDMLTQNKNNINSSQDIQDITKLFIEKHGLKFPQLFQPIRLSLTGKTTAPAVYDIVWVLGIDETICRIKTAISKGFKTT